MARPLAALFTARSRWFDLGVFAPVWSWSARSTFDGGPGRRHDVRGAAAQHPADRGDREVPDGPGQRRGRHRGRLRLEHPDVPAVHAGPARGAGDLVARACWSPRSPPTSGHGEDLQRRRRDRRRRGGRCRAPTRPRRRRRSGGPSSCSRWRSPRRPTSPPTSCCPRSRWRSRPRPRCANHLVQRGTLIAVACFVPFDSLGYLGAVLYRDHAGGRCCCSACRWPPCWSPPGR